MPTKNPRIRKLILILSIVLFLIATILLVIGLWPYRSAILVNSKSWQQLNDTISPYITIKVPEGNGKFPVVLVFPGCEGVKPERAKPRMNWLAEQGYIAVMVDSHSGRGLDEDTVCDGYALWGSERAGDIYVALNFIQHHPQADINKIALLGYSHGGWTILDALSYNGTPPRGLDTVPDNLLNQVKAAAIYYPYCGYPSRARYTFNSPIPILAIHAEQDTMVDPQACKTMMHAWQEKGLPVTSLSYDNTGHAFDVIGHDNFKKESHLKALNALASFLSQAFEEI